MMNIFVIGGTGLVGSYLLPELVLKKYKVYALTRSEDKIRKLQTIGCRGIPGDIRNPEGFKSFLPERVDIIVLLAMPGIRPGRRITAKRKKELRCETNDFFKNSMDLAVQYNAPVILPSGTSYATTQDEMADETWPILRNGITEIGRDTDGMIDTAIRTGKPGIIQLIYGKIYGNGGLFRFMYEMMEKGRAKIIGDGNNYIPNIHARDAAFAIIKSVEKMPLGEKFIIADDTPVRQKDFTSCMAALMNKKQPARIPGFIVRLILGNDIYQVIKMNCKVSNEKAKRILDWKPEFPSYEEGLKAAIDEMKENRPFFE
jgi:nucleoside-diphosphate-sugar epimerase